MKYLGLDLGKRSLGISISDKTGIIASFYKSIRYENEEELITEIDKIVTFEEIGEIILGYPKNMDNSEGFRAQETLQFKEQLEQKIGKRVILQDERLTTRVAEGILLEADLSRNKRKKIIDGVSAIVILQTYLDKKEKNYE